MRKIAEKETEKQTQLRKERGCSNVAKYIAERVLAAVRAREAHCIISKRKNKSFGLAAVASTSAVDVEAVASTSAAN